MYNPYDSGRDVGNLLASQLLTEQSQPLRERRIVAIFSGRFQPFHQGHYSVYEHLVERFGAKNVYIGTSNTTDSKKSPFSYGEKHEIITHMFGIPENKVHQVRLPLRPIEILNRLPEGIAFVTAISEKDDPSRFAGKYYERFPDDVSDLKEYRERGYFVEVPVGGNNISGTEIREVLGNPATDLKAKKESFREIYGRFDSKIFELIVNRLSPPAATEAITIPVEVGDTILTGKFKNKKTVVKDIGTDDHDMPTINGRKAATFRMTKDETSEGVEGEMISRVAVNEYRSRVARKKLISEGGAAGHMDHPFEDMSLTFGDLKQLVSLGLDGKLNVEAPVTEKLDGQNIFVSYCNGRVVFARNKSHMKGRGTDALDVDGIRQMFDGRGEISDAFTLAAQDLDRAIRSLSPSQVNDVFNDGSKWASLEIIYPATQNVIPYGLNMLVFHNTIEVDDNGDAVGVGGNAQNLVDMIKKINQGVQNTFSFGGPVVVSLPRSKNFARRKGHYTRRITKLQRQHKLKDSEKVIMWHQCWWEDFIDSRAAKYKYRMPNNVRQGLLRRWAFQESGSYPIATMKKEIITQNTVKDTRAQKFLDWALSYDKGGKAEQFKTNIAPFEKIFLELGAEILTNVKDLLTVSPGDAAESMRNDLDSTIKELRKTTDVKKIVQVKQQLANLESMGDCIVPTEGIVFMFKDKLFKFTGTFAPMNQLMNLNLG